LPIQSLSFANRLASSAYAMVMVFLSNVIFIFFPFLAVLPMPQHFDFVMPV
jgi:hypothetical protein